MRIEIEIPKEFEAEYKTDKFNHFFSRVMCDMEKGLLCGNYEKETADMLLSVFWESKIAYDVEAVVAELEKLKEEPSGCHGLGCDECKYTRKCFSGEQDYKVFADRAISIVRGKE